MVLWWQWETADARPRRSARNNTCSPSDGDNSVRKLWQLLEIWDTALMDKSIQRAKFALAVLRALDNFHSTVWQEIKGKYLPEVLFCQQCTWMVSAFCKETENKTEPKLSVPIAWQRSPWEIPMDLENVCSTPFGFPKRKVSSQHWWFSCFFMLEIYVCFKLSCNKILTNWD